MYWGTPHYTTIAELQAKAQKSLAKNKKKNWHPIILKGKTIATSWWGKAWCENLESYADFANRIDRGKKYVRAGMVLDLQISKGKVLAVVQGSRATPYNVEVSIASLSKKAGEAIAQSCTNKAADLDSLLNGCFPEDMKALFSKKGGLFPAPSEISFHCSCPDWASMCKHVAAVLYAIAVRFDEDPLLFFELRGIDFNCFIDKALAGKIDELLKNAEAGKHSSRILDESRDLTELFGVL